MKVKKAVIPAAGLGTRVLPATKAMPKEMLPILDKPSIQYIVEEAVQAGIEDILIITNRGKEIIEDHFDRSVELEQHLKRQGKDEMYNEIVKISNLANIYFIRQKEIRGLGHAIGRARSFVGNEPFAVLYGDDVILSDNPVTAQLCRAYEKYSLAVAGIKESPLSDVIKYCTLKVDSLGDNIYKISDMIEKPSPDQIMSMFSILGRCILTPDIFDIIDSTPPGANNEIQLTDAMATLAREKGMIGVDFVGTRYDMGNKLGILKATIEVALKHPEVSKDFTEYLKNLCKEL